MPTSGRCSNGWPPEEPPVNEAMRRIAKEGEARRIVCEEAPWTDLFAIGPFRFFYTLDGTASSPADPAATLRSGVPDYILRLAAAFTEAFAIYTGTLGLADPLQKGRFQRQGARFIDLLIDDIPTQRGLVAGSAAEAGGCFKDDAAMQGKAVRIRLHRDLIAQTATPIHELFHVFQYAYAPFTNAWFMEGLARWSQTLIQHRRMKEETLPRTREALDALLVRAHDAEYFWRRLFALCGGEAPVRPLLEAVAAEAEAIERRGGGDFVWDKRHKGAFSNNAALLRALAGTLRGHCASGSSELEAFLALCDAPHPSADALSDAPLQHFYRVLQKAAPGAVLEHAGRLACDDFDVATRRLVLPVLDVSMLDRYELDALNVVEQLEGELRFDGSQLEALNGFNYLRRAGAVHIEAMPNLTAVRGFNALETVGRLTIRKNPHLQEIDGFNVLFGVTHEAPGAVRVTDNPALTSVRFLHGLKRTGSSLYLHGNALQTLEGLESLETVGASLSLSSNRLASLAPLANLVSVGGMLGVAYNALISLGGLENLRRLKTVAWNGQYRTLALQGNPDLDDIAALSSVRSRDGEMIVLTESRTPRRRPSWDSPFFENTFRIEDVGGRKRRNKAELFDMRGAPMRILFSKMGAGWTAALTHTEGLDARFAAFDSAQTLIDDCYAHAVTTVMPVGIPAQQFAARHRQQLRAAGLHLMGAEEETYRLLKDKQRFYAFMCEHGWERYVPRRFEYAGAKTFPLIVKPRVGSGGKGSRIVHGAEELGPEEAGALLEEYIPASEEYAANLLIAEGRTVGHVTYRKKANSAEYILGQGDTDQHHIVNEKCETAFLPLFESILNACGFSGLCCVDYKVQNGEPKVFEINARLGFTLASAPEDLLPMLRRYEAQAEAAQKPRVLFGHNWTRATARCGWMEAHHLRFGDPDALVRYCAEHGIGVLFGNNYASQKWIAEHADLLRLHGLKFIANTLPTLGVFVDKQTFDARMRAAGFGASIPAVYASKEAVRYPCVVKPRSGGAGRGIFIAESPDDVEKAGGGAMLTEYLPGEDEYATSIFYKDGRILHHRTYRKHARREPYILQREEGVDVTPCETPFTGLFEAIVGALNGAEGYCLCSMNYKIVGGELKLFEINPRTGYTLAQHPEDFREFMLLYLKEAAV